MSQLGEPGSPTLPGLICSTQETDKEPLRRSMGKFAVVGLVNNVIGYGAFVLLSVAGMHAITAMTISYALGMAISFVGNRKWTFGHQGKIAGALMRFLGVNAVGYGLNFAILTILVLGFQLPQIPVQLFALGFVAVVSFLLMRLWAFRNMTADTEGSSGK